MVPYWGRGTQGGVLLGVFPDFISMGHSSPGFAPSGEVLSLACPRERHPHPSSADADSLRSSPNRASRATRSHYGIFDPVMACLEQGALLLPGLAAVLGEGNGISGTTPKPVGAAEHRMPHPAQQDARNGRRAALFELDLQAEGAANPASSASSASAQTGEKRRARLRSGLVSSRGLAAKPPGLPFFWILFFGGAKKSISPKGRNPP
jgi:hypothetical protein